MTEDEIGRSIVDLSIDLHKDLGPGLLETVYEVVLSHELRRRGLGVVRQAVVPIEYRGIKFDAAFRADLIVEDKVIIELKCLRMLDNSHRKQLLTYLRLTNKKLGYLLNFGAPLMKHGIVRTVNRL